MISLFLSTVLQHVVGSSRLARRWGVLELMLFGRRRAA